MSSTGKMLYCLYVWLGGLCCLAALIVFASIWSQGREVGSSVSVAMSPLGLGTVFFLAADRLKFWGAVFRRKSRVPVRRGRVAKIPASRPY
jgi:hypothetical protein